MFSDDEVEAAIATYLSTSVDATTLVSGSRDVVGTQQQVYELIASAFFLRPASFYYVAYLASNRLRSLCVAQLVDLATIAATAPDVSRNAQIITGVSDLVNADAAITALNTALQGRALGVKGAVSPAIQRFNSSVETFIRNELVKNTVVAGSVVYTAQEARDLVAATWARAATRGATITALATSIRDAAADYAVAKLPVQTFRNLTSKIQARLRALQADLAGTAPASRAALLELFVMRTLLTRVSTFFPPQVVLAPLHGDPSTGTLQNSAGIGAAVLGTVSGPFNYAAGTVLTLGINGPPVSPTLPGASNAVVRSAVLSPWVVPSAGKTVAVAVDHGATVTSAVASWANGTVAAAALDTALTGVSVAWDAGTNQLVFTSQQSGDVSSLRFVGGAGAQNNFLAWAFAGVAPWGVATPVRSAEVLAALTASSATLVVDERVVQYGSFAGSRSTTGGEEDRFIPTDPTGLLAVQIGARVQLDTATLENAGYYRVATVTANYLIFDRPIPSADTAAVASVFAEYIDLSIASTTTDTTLEVTAGAAAAALGLATTPASSQLSLLRVAGLNFATRRVEPGDLLSLTAPSNATYEAVLTAVATTDLSFDPAVPYEAGSWGYVVSGSGAAAYETAATACSTFLGDQDLQATGVAAGRLTRGAKYSAELQTALGDYVAATGALGAAMAAFSVDAVPDIGAAVQLMQEHGFDRALDLFLSMDLSTFFGLSADGVSYATWLVRQSATVAREVAPVTKGTRDTAGQFRGISTQSTAFEPNTGGK